MDVEVDVSAGALAPGEDVVVVTRPSLKHLLRTIKLFWNQNDPGCSTLRVAAVVASRVR
jgi:hypothetical protein